jgi:hypothetical protein
MQRSKLSVLGIFVALVATSLTLLAQKRSVLDTNPPVRGIHWARGQQPAQTRGGNPDLTWHGGPIMETAQTAAIFWGSNWSNQNFVSDKITGLDSWYIGVGGSAYGATVDEFTGPQGTRVSDTIGYLGHYVDATPGPSRAPKTSAVLAEVCKVIPQSQLASNGYYAVYIDAPRAHAGYCAWHSAGSCGGVPIQFAFFFNLDGDAGCDPQSTITTQSQGLAALANVSGHELSEARNDPRLNAWYDSSGAENADKCSWTFGGPYVSFGNTRWKIQGNWSNYAYDNNLGYPNRSGQNGCVDGTNVPGSFN